MIGNAIEGIVIATVNVSQLWIFDFVADSGKGGQAYINRLQDELVDKGYIESKKVSSSLQELLEGLERTPSSFAKNIDTHPLSREDVVDNIDEIRDSISELWSSTGKAAGDVTEEIANVMQEFLDTATEEG